jgi:hypothetical protein
MGLTCSIGNELISIPPRSFFYMAEKKVQTAEKRVQTATLSINIAAKGYRRRMYFNRFAIETIDDRLLLRFGLVREAAAPPLDAFDCIIDKLDLQANLERIGMYLSQLESVPPAEAILWTPAFLPAGIEVITALNFARAKDAAEILLSTYSMHGIVTASKSPKSAVVETEPVAMLRCSAQLQKLFATKLYRSIK